MRYPLLSLFLLATTLLQAQATYDKFQWASTPVIHTVDPKYRDAAAVYINDDRINEYVIEKDGFYFYHTQHRIVHLNNDKGIESFNKIYLPFDEGGEVIDVKARTILPGGKIIEMDRKNIKDLKDDDGQYKIFALEGLTKGCEVEYYFTLRKDPSFFGREVLSSKIPSMKSHFALITPAHLVFETKSFNGFPEGKDSVINEKRYKIIDDQSDEALEEKYSMYKANLKRVEFKLCYNNAKNSMERLFTWNELAKKVYSIYAVFSDKDMKQIKGLLSDINPKGTEVEQIMAIENYMKKHFTNRKDINDEGDLAKMIRNKVVSNNAIAHLYAGLFLAAGINNQIVLAGDRNDYCIDPKFENWNNTQNFLFYFPSTKKYLTPTEIEFRYPWIPPSWAATNGLFCVPTTIGNFTTAMGEVRPINLENTNLSFLNLDMHLKLLQEDTLQLDVKQTYGGYAAGNYRFPFNFFNADQQHDFLKELIKFGTNSENILSHSFENKEMELADPYKPFVINASVKSTNLIEKAGDKMLLKVGDLIGEQSEMYDAKTRTTPIELEFPHEMNRVIDLEIPEGYVVKNPGDLRISTIYKDGDDETMGFESSYTQTGNVLHIVIKEKYNRVSYPLVQYEQFKKVINASADFNKIVLILVKS